MNPSTLIGYNRGCASDKSILQYFPALKLFKRFSPLWRLSLMPNSLSHRDWLEVVKS